MCVLFSLFCVWFVYWYWQRRKRRQAERPNSPDADDPEMSESTTRRYPRTTGLPSDGELGLAGSSSGRSLGSRWRRPPPPPPRSKTRGNKSKPIRAQKTLSTIPESSGDGDTLKQTLSITEVDEGQDSQGSLQSHESTTLSSPSSLVSPEDQRTDPDISITPTRPSVRLVSDSR